MKKYKFGLLVFMIILQPVIFCGCWNSREIDTLAIVAGIALDKDPVDNKYITTVEVISTDTQGTITKIDSELYSAKGDTIFEAIRNTIEETGLKLYWSDAKVVIISQELARIGMIPLIDWPLRDSETRIDMWLLISMDPTAAEILKYKVKLNPVTSFHIDDTMRSETIISKYTDSRLWSFAENISAASAASTVASVKNESLDSIKAAKVSGCGIFKYDKLIGFIDGNETLYMHMINNKISVGVLSFKDVGDLGNNITMEIYSNKTQLTPSFENEEFSMLINVEITLGIAEIGGSENFMEEAKLKKLKAEIEKRLKKELNKLISKMQLGFGLDIFGFENKLSSSMPQQYKKLKNSGEEIFRNINTKINVNVKIKSSGIMIKPISKE